MTAADSSSSPSAPAPPPENADVIEHSLPCVHCGYDLLRQPTAGRCPECGIPVRASLRGDWLQFCHPAWVRSLSRGMLLIFAAYSLYYAALIPWVGYTGLRVFQVSPPAQLMTPSGFSEIIKCLGLWLLAAPEPRLALRQTFLSLTQVLRTLAILSIVAECLSYAFFTTHSPASDTGKWIALTLGLATTYLLFWQLQRLARRIPSPALEISTIMFLWAIPGSIVILILARALQRVIRDSSLNLSLLFPMLAASFLAIWSYALLASYTRDLTQAARSARRNANTPHA